MGRKIGHHGAKLNLGHFLSKHSTYAQDTHSALAACAMSGEQNVAGVAGQYHFRRSLFVPSAGRTSQVLRDSVTPGARCLCHLAGRI